MTVYVAGNPVPLTTERDSLQGSIRTSQPVRIGRRSSSLPLAGSLRNIRLDEHFLAGDQIRARIATDLSAAVVISPPRDSASDAWRHYFTTSISSRLAGTRSDSNQAERATHRRSIPTVMVLKERTERRPTYRLQRGQYDLPDKREELLPDVPAFLPPLPADAPRDRSGSGASGWLTRTTRWSRVLSSIDCGNASLAKACSSRPRISEPRPTRPSHPQLLDWLASELMRTGWDLKAIQKLIVMSATYQQSSAVSAELAARDPDNRLLGPRPAISFVGRIDSRQRAWR